MVARTASRPSRPPIGGRWGAAPRDHSGPTWRTPLTLVWLVLADLILPQQELYVNFEYGVSLLAATGTVGCIGYLLAIVFRLDRPPLGPQASLFVISSSTVLSSVSARAGSEDWPLLVALLFGSILNLFSGLGGWVEPRPCAVGPAPSILTA